MKIIGVDNYARDFVSETLVAENVNEHYANLIVGKLNDNEWNDTYFMAVDNAHVLYEFDPT